MIALIPRILSVFGPLLVYLSLGLLLWALFKNRERLDRHVPAVVALALATSFVFVEASHRLFFDEDIYIQIASNLSRAPVAQLTLLGSPETVEVSTYYKEPVGYPTLLGLLFAVSGPSEGAAFVFARILFAFTVGGVYLLARDTFRQSWMGWMAALAFLTTPPVLEYSVSAGTDLVTVLFAVLGVWGLVSGAYPLAVAGLALAAQMRLEAVVLTLFLFASPALGRRWKLIGLALISGQLFHLGWVLSAAPAYAASVGVEAAFSPAYVPANFVGSLGYLLNGGRFPWGISVLAALSLLAWGVRTLRSQSGKDTRPKLGEFYFVAWIGLMMAVYLAFYEGSFDLNPRYSIQTAVPMILLGVTALKLFNTRQGLVVVIGVAFTLLYSNLSPKPPDQDHSVAVDDLAADHRRMAQIAGELGEGSIVIAGEPEVFLNHGVAALHAIFASERPRVIGPQAGRYPSVRYYSGVRASDAGSENWRADRRIKSEYSLRLIESYSVGTGRSALYEVLLDASNREGRLIGSFENE